MDLEPVKRSAKRREEKTFSLVADQEIYYFKKRDKLLSSLDLTCVYVCMFVLFVVMQKAVTVLQGMGNNSL